MSNVITTKAPVEDLRSAITRLQPQFKAALPAHVPPERFVRIIHTALGTNPKLMECERSSLFASCLKAAQDGLLPDGREGVILPFRNKEGGYAAQWLPMVGGIMKKARNSGEIGAWSVQVVKKNDVFEYEMGDNAHITHKPALSNRGEIVGAYSIVTLKGGEKSREFMNAEEIEVIRTRSKSRDNGPWVTDYDEMAKKTVVKRHCKRLPASTDVDEFIRKEDEQDRAEIVNAPLPVAPAPKAQSSRLSEAVKPKEDATPEEMAADAMDADMANRVERDK